MQLTFLQSLLPSRDKKHFSQVDIDQLLSQICFYLCLLIFFIFFIQTLKSLAFPLSSYLITHISTAVHIPVSTPSVLAPCLLQAFSSLAFTSKYFLIILLFLSEPYSKVCFSIFLNEWGCCLLLCYQFLILLSCVQKIGCV